MSSVIWSALALVGIALVLSFAFREVVEKRFDETLNVYLSMLIGQLADGSDGGQVPTEELVPALSDPRFLLPLSGWYWAVHDVKSGETVLASDSLAGDRIAVPPAFLSMDGGQFRDGYSEGPGGDALRLVARQITITDDRWLLVIVSGDAATIEGDTAQFTARLAVLLGLFAVILVAITFIQWRTALRPLTALRKDLSAVQEGHARRVGSAYPSEIAPVADALNMMIETNQATLERARRHVGNLAHALKTPLSVMVNDAAGEETGLARSVREQSSTMQRQVRYYLERAQMAAKERMIGASTDVGGALERLHRAMARLGERRGIDVRLTISEPLRFAGERQDFEEIVGNLVDNGLKWAVCEVAIAVEPARATALGRAGMLRVTIDDDGPGLTVEQRRKALSRGQRLDQSKPGSGLGLSIVSELVDLYGGTLVLERSPKGGLRVAVVLPRS
ncbi:MAG: ATP-binding protein [Pseudomonadota bacterium]